MLLGRTEIQTKICHKFCRWGLGQGINIAMGREDGISSLHEDVIETDDGQLLKAYSEEVCSPTTVKSEVGGMNKADQNACLHSHAC